MKSRMLPVPDGLDGMRLDAGLAKLLGLSRTVVAELAAAGDVLVDGRPAGKSDRLSAGGLLEVALPEPARPIEVTPVLVDGLSVLYTD
ncbi:MAG: S4 domain-containing protein, partial [Haloechinothrix sp.]